MRQPPLGGKERYEGKVRSELRRTTFLAKEGEEAIASHLQKLRLAKIVDVVADTLRTTFLAKEGEEAIA